MTNPFESHWVWITGGKSIKPENKKLRALTVHSDRKNPELSRAVTTSVLLN